MESGTIFVFGSNLAGRHGKGAALHARQHFGAIYGKGEGRQGESYAIPTKDRDLRSLPLETIAGHVARFLRYAKEHPGARFQVTRIGCGLAGYTDEQIAPDGPQPTTPSGSGGHFAPRGGGHNSFTDGES